MGDLGSFADDAYKKIEDNAKGVAGALTGGTRTPPEMADGKPVFHNGTDLAAPDGQETHKGSADPGGSTAVLDETIEFIHFGRTYRDRQGFFAHDKIDDDSDPKAKLKDLASLRAIQYRAALEREAILLAGLVASHRAALDARESGESTLGKVLGVVGNLLGGAGTASATAVGMDLNPVFADINKAAAALDVTDITYAITHQAGIDLHTARAKYIQYIQDQLEQRKKPKEQAGLLSSIPLLSSVLPPEIAHIFALVEQMSEKAFDVYVGIVVELTQLMSPILEGPCGEASIDAITSRKAPIFDIWFPPHDDKAGGANDLIQKVKSPGKTGIGAIDGIVDGVLNPVNGVIGDVDDTAAPYIDFLTRPGKTAPGGKFLDKVFEQVADKSGYLKSIGKTTLGDVAYTAIKDSFGFEMPDFVKTIVTKVMDGHANFLRGIYGKLIELDPEKAISEGDLVAAGREHLVRQLIESLAHGVGFLDQIRAFSFNLDVFGPLKRQLSGEALYQRGMEFLNEELTPHLDGIIELLMKDFAKELESVRVSAIYSAMTMEVYLARLPSLYALLFRKTFFPIWDLMVNTIFKGVADLLNPMVGDVTGLANKAKGIVETVRDGALRTKSLIHDVLNGAHISSYDDAQKLIGQFNKDANLDAADVPSPGGSVAPADGFPYVLRKSSGTGKPIDDAMEKDVATHNKWRDDEPVGGPVAGDGSAAPDGDKTSGAPAAPKLPL